MTTKRRGLIGKVMIPALLLSGASLPPAFAREPSQYFVAAEAAAPQKLITTISLSQLQQVLADEGYSVSVNPQGHLEWKINGQRTVLLLGKNGQSLQFFVGFGGGNGSLRKVNEWNRSKRFSRSYIDEDGDPILEIDLDLEGGVSKQRLISFLATCHVSFETWHEEVVK